MKFISLKKFKEGKEFGKCPKCNGQIESSDIIGYGLFNYKSAIGYKCSHCNCKIAIEVPVEYVEELAGPDYSSMQPHAI